MLTPAPQIDPATAGEKVKSGTALLVDVREPDEWAGGVAEGAALLPLSDLNGPRTQWKPFLAQARGKEIYVYCASGMRSGSVAKTLAAEGINAANTGGLRDWANSGWPIVRPGSAT